MVRVVLRASLPYLVAATVVGLHLEKRLSPPPAEHPVLMEEQSPPPRRAPKADPETARPSPILPV